MPRGGPDGGDGGHGGDVVLVCDASRRDLGALRGSRHWRAQRGRHGEGSNKHGARGEDLTIPVPAGTQAEAVDGSRVDLVEVGQRAVVAKGGRGGHGNRRYATSTRQAPRFAEKGTSGEQGWIEVRLKLLADVGLVGLPNAGKSSLLGRLTRAEPKVGDYPFTTLSPVLGTIEGADRQAVVADIPGLIEGAAGGAGLGHEFLAHVERCSMLVHLVDLAPLEGEPESNYEAVREELTAYGAGLERLPELVVLSKRDLLPGEQVEQAVGEWRRRLGERARRCSRSPRRPARGWTSCAARSSPICPRRRPRAARAARPRPGRVRGRAPRLPPGRRGRLHGRARGGRRLPRPRPRRRAALRAPRPEKRRGARLPRAAPQRDRRRSRPARRRLPARRRRPGGRARVRAAPVRMAG